MKNTFTFLILLFLTVSASTVSLNSSILEKNETESIASTATELLSLFDDDKKATKCVSSLLGGLKVNDAMKTVGALQSLASLDFSKEQLSQYGTLLSQIAPMLLASNFDLENGELGQYIGKAMKYLQSENFAAASSAVTTALKYVDTESVQQALLNGLISSYAPMLTDLDLGQALEIGKSVMDKVSSGVQ